MAFVARNLKIRQGEKVSKRITRDKINILFKSEPFMAKVEEMGDEDRKCVSAVFSRGRTIHGLIVFSGEQRIIWENSLWYEGPISLWRATEIISKLEFINSKILGKLADVGARSEYKNPEQAAIIEKIGWDTYRQIMKIPVPEIIITEILEGQKEIFKPDLRLITKEIRAGTIQWRPEFADAGVGNPEEIDATKRKNAEILAPFDKLLNSYAASQGWTRPYYGITVDVDNALLTLIEKGADKKYSPAILVALAGVGGEFFRFNATYNFPELKDKYRGKHEKSLNDIKTKAAKWLVKKSNSSLFAKLCFWEKTIQQEEAENILTQLFKEYLSL